MVGKSPPLPTGIIVNLAVGRLPDRSELAGGTAEDGHRSCLTPWVNDDRYYTGKGSVGGLACHVHVEWDSSRASSAAGASAVPH
jgi:hypothetical protein